MCFHNYKKYLFLFSYNIIHAMRLLLRLSTNINYVQVGYHIKFED